MGVRLRKKIDERRSPSFARQLQFVIARVGRARLNYRLIINLNYRCELVYSRNRANIWDSTKHAALRTR